MSRLLVKREGVGSALILIEDITEEHRKEQALRVKSALIREIHHRVKNNLQTIAALLRMQARRTGSPEVLDMLKQSINRILSIALVHEFLSKDDATGEAIPDQHSGRHTADAERGRAGNPGSGEEHPRHAGGGGLLPSSSAGHLLRASHQRTAAERGGAWFRQQERGIASRSSCRKATAR